MPCDVRRLATAAETTTAPAAYVAMAANEAEKKADIDIIAVRTIGRFGRFFMSSSEASVQAAMQAMTEAERAWLATAASAIRERLG